MGSLCQQEAGVHPLESGRLDLGHCSLARNSSAASKHHRNLKVPLALPGCESLHASKPTCVKLRFVVVTITTYQSLGTVLEAESPRSCRSTCFTAVEDLSVCVCMCCCCYQDLRELMFAQGTWWQLTCMWNVILTTALVK